MIASRALLSAGEVSWHCDCDTQMFLSLAAAVTQMLLIVDLGGVQREIPLELWS